MIPIWIEGKKLSGLQKKLSMENPHFRVDVGSLTTILGKKRKVVDGFLFGSESPPVDTVWKSIREKGWKVKTIKKVFGQAKKKKYGFKNY
jgi:hypothetical protein